MIIKIIYNLETCQVTLSIPKINTKQLSKEIYLKKKKKYAFKLIVIQFE